MTIRDFFEQTIPIMLRNNPCPDRDMVLKHIRERAYNMNEQHSRERVDNMYEQNNKSRTRFSKKAVIIPVIIAALSLLTGAVIHEVYRIGFEESDLITELKVGHYYLETVDGYSDDCYIEVFEDNKLQFFGIDRKEVFENGNSVDWNTAPVEYRIMENIPFIAVNDAWNTLNNDNSDIGAFLGITYEDENTLVWNVDAEKYPNAKNYAREENKDDFDEHGIICAHFVFGSPVYSN